MAGQSDESENRCRLLIKLSWGNILGSMPANLTPQYLEAENSFKQAKTIEEKIKALEVMMAVIPKHKGTEHLRGQLKSRMAKLRQEQQKGRGRVEDQGRIESSQR